VESEAGQGAGLADRRCETRLYPRRTAYSVLARLLLREPFGMAFSAPPNSGPTVRLPRILLVDDDPIVLRALRRLLLGGRPGWEIDVAESGDAALSRLESKTYDVVVTDLHMPGLDGVTLLGRLKTKHPNVMRVVHSSHVESLPPEQAQELAHAVLTKPGRPDELVVVLQWALAQRRKQARDSVGS
jgi:CheY-like chemotaxis protein